MPKIPVIDTHLHFWDLATYSIDAYPWLVAQPTICRNFLPPDLKPHFDACGVEYGVIIEAARDSHALNLWWLELAKQYKYIGAAVLGCTLEQENLADWFDEYTHNPAFVGVRTAPVGPPEQWSTNSATAHGLHELARRDLSLDLLVGYDCFPAVGELAARYPELRIILDHCAHPPFRENQLDAWATALAPLAQYPNLSIKYSSFLLYTYPDSAPTRLQPVADLLLEKFGVGRLLWGSNWPVELLGGTYEAAFRVMQMCLEPLSETEKAALYGGNAATFYRVKV